MIRKIIDHKSFPIIIKSIDKNQEKNRIINKIVIGDLEVFISKPITVGKNIFNIIQST